MNGKRLRLLIGTSALATATLLALGASAATTASHSESFSSFQLLVAASPSSSEPGVWSLGVRAYDRQDGKLVAEPAIDTIDGEEATFFITNARTGENLRLVVKVEQGERKPGR